MATAPSPNDLTRQQLDELDALLQKMLTVPLAPVDPSPPPVTLAPLAQPPLPPSWRVDPPAAPSLAHIATAEPPATLKFEQAPAPAPVPVPVAVAKAPKPAQPPAPTLPPVQAPAPALNQAPPVAPAAPKAAPVPAPKPAAPAPTPPADSLPVPLAAIPFVALNGLFDSICGVFGPLGRLLCSGFFKNLYGLAGLGLIVYTALHVAQVQGWLTLPVQLPWPK